MPATIRLATNIDIEIASRTDPSDCHALLKEKIASGDLAVVTMTVEALREFKPALLDNMKKNLFADCAVSFAFSNSQFDIALYLIGQEFKIKNYQPILNAYTRHAINETTCKNFLSVAKIAHDPIMEDAWGDALISYPEQSFKDKNYYKDMVALHKTNNLEIYDLCKRLHLLNPNTFKPGASLLMAAKVNAFNIVTYLINTHCPVNKNFLLIEYSPYLLKALQRGSIESFKLLIAEDAHHWKAESTANKYLSKLTFPVDTQQEPFYRCATYLLAFVAMKQFYKKPTLKNQNAAQEAYLRLTKEEDRESIYNKFSSFENFERFTRNVKGEEIKISNIEEKSQASNSTTRVFLQLEIFSQVEGQSHEIQPQETVSNDTSTSEEQKPTVYEVNNNSQEGKHIPFVLRY